LYAARNDFELPADIQGINYHAYDPDGKWQFDLLRELTANGIKVDANKLL
jgi:predicted nucleotide-binding protein